MAEHKTVAVMRASPRKRGNTNWLTDIVVSELRAGGCDVIEFELFDMTIKPCTACRWCQKDWNSVSCFQKDDMQPIFDAIMKSDTILLSTPIYSWYCTPPMKAMLDRLVYAMNMYYGDERGPSLWAGKRMCIVTTCGLRPEKGADLFLEGMRRYCKYSGLVFGDVLCERHLGYKTVFPDEEKRAHAVEFAKKLI